MKLWSKLLIAAERISNRQIELDKCRPLFYSSRVFMNLPTEENL